MRRPLEGLGFLLAGPASSHATATRNLTGLPGIENLRLTLGVNNLFNSHAVTDNAGLAAAGPPYPNLVNVLARTNFMLSAVADF